MKICEYIHNLTDIKFVQSLVLNKNNQKKIEIDKNIHVDYDIFYLLSVNPMYYYGYGIYTTLKVRLRDIEYPYLQFIEWLEHPNIREGKITSIDTLKDIELMFR